MRGIVRICSSVRASQIPPQQWRRTTHALRKRRRLCRVDAPDTKIAHTSQSHTIRCKCALLLLRAVRWVKYSIDILGRIPLEQYRMSERAFVARLSGTHDPINSIFVVRMWSTGFSHTRRARRSSDCRTHRAHTAVNLQSARQLAAGSTRLSVPIRSRAPAIR